MESALHRAGRDPGLQLIETLYWDGRHAPRWPLHLARLRESAALLGWPPPRPPAMPEPAGPARLRLTMDRSGGFEWQSGALAASPAIWRIGIAPQILDESDPMRALKSSRRALHDQCRAALPAGLEELVFVNRRGHLAEGTITNLFFDRGQGLRTPPCSAGALPGVLRRALACPEEELAPADLPQVRLWVGNALRGLIPARLVGAASPPD